MNERNDLLGSIAATIKDYRAGEIDKPTPEHVDRWIKQFDASVQIPLMREIDHVFKKTYLNREIATGFFGSLVKNEKISGGNHCVFWASANFLNIQQHGHSQQEVLALIDATLQEQCGLNLADCGAPGGDYFYIDDVMFSGSRVGNDLASWIEKSAPAIATVHIVVIALHTGGHWLVGNRLKKAIADSGKKISVNFWRAVELENQKASRNNSEVLWPVAIPDNELVKAYAARPQKFPFEARTPGGKLGLFSSEEGRQLLEREMLIAGVKIRSLSKNPKDIIRPLGFSPFGLGFGSMIVTYRNCPNNCPLALWWGDPDATSGPFHWYPLLPRKTYV